MSLIGTLTKAAQTGSPALTGIPTRALIGAQAPTGTQMMTAQTGTLDPTSKEVTGSVRWSSTEEKAVEDQSHEEHLCIFSLCNSYK